MIAAALAALALALGFVTLAMNQTASKAAPHVIIPLKDRHHSAVAASATKKAVVKRAVKRPDVHLVAALKAGLPRSIAEGLAKRSVVVVELWSARDPVGKLSAGEAQAGAGLAGAAYVGVNIDADGGAAGVLTTALGKLPDAPATLVYTRPAKLMITMPGFNDRTAVQQAASSAAGEKSSDQASAA